MQLVKNIFVQQALELPTEQERTDAYNEATATTLDRKLKEMKLAIGLEKKYTKKEILVAYLNIAFFGDNTYGIQAAAQRYYSVDAKDLTAEQAASLVAIVQYPLQRGLFDPANYEANQARRDVILDSMLDAGDLSQADHDAAIAIPVDDTSLKPSEPAERLRRREHLRDLVLRLRGPQRRRLHVPGSRHRHPRGQLEEGWLQALHDPRPRRAGERAEPDLDLCEQPGDGVGPG